MEDKIRIDTATVRFRDSIRWKLEITIVGIIVALVMILTMLQISSQQESLQKALSTHSSFLREEMIAQADKAAAHLSADIHDMISPFRIASVNSYVLDAVKDIRDLQYIILMQGTVPRVAHGANLSGDLRRKILSGDVSAYTARQREAMKHEFVVGDHAFMESVVPVKLDGEHWGVLRVGFSLDHLNQTLAQVIFYLLPYAVFAKPLQQVSQAIIGEVFHIHCLWNQSRQSLYVLVSPGFHLDHAMIRFRDYVTQPGSGQPTYAQPFPIAMRRYDLIQDGRKPHLFLLGNQQWYIIYSFDLDFDLCHSRGLPHFSTPSKKSKRSIVFKRLRLTRQNPHWPS